MFKKRKMKSKLMTIVLNFFLLGALLVSFPCFTQEQITLTTYYPAPYGVYNALRFFPHDEIDSSAACTKAGEIYYDNSEDALYLCDGLAWKSLGGGYWDYSSGYLYPQDTAWNVAIGKDSVIDGYKLDVQGKLKAKNIYTVNVQNTAADCNISDGSEYNWCDKTISFPAGRFSSTPIGLCSRGYTPVVFPDPPPIYRPASCTVRDVTAASARVIVDVHDPNSEMGMRDSPLIHAIFIEP